MERKIVVSNESKPISLDALIARNNRDGIITYLSEYVPEIAKKYQRDLPKGVESDDLIGAGYEALVSYVRGQPVLRRSTFESNCRSAIEKGIQHYVLGEIADKSNLVYDSQKLDRVTVPPTQTIGKDIHHARSAIQDVLATLPENQRKALEMAYSLPPEEGVLWYASKPVGHREIGKALGKTRGWAHGAIRRAFNLLRGHPDYAPLLTDVLEDLEGIRADAQTTSLPEVRLELKGELDEAKRYFEERLGNLVSFRHHYGMSRNQLAAYLSRLHPGLPPRNSLKIVELTEEERAKLQDVGIGAIEKYRDIASIKRTIGELEKSGRVPSRDDKDLVTDTIRELYVPLFATDPQKCIDLLDQESNSNGNPPQLRVFYRQAHSYFKDVRNLTVKGVKTPLDDFQKVDVEILARRNASIIASDMGVGKSLEAIAYATHVGLENVLVTTTKSGAQVTWPRELRKHLDGDRNVVLLTGKMLRDDEVSVSTNVPNWYVTTHATATRYVDRIRRLGLDGIIIDESHRINNDATQQSLALTSLDAPHKLAISGSVFKNTRSELFPLLNWLFPTDFPDQDDFHRTYCRNNEGIFRLQYELRRKMILRFKDQVLRLPKVDHIHETVTMKPAQEKGYREMEDDFLKWYEEHVEKTPPGLLGGTVLMKMHRLRQAAIEPKMSLIEELATQSIADGRKAVIYTTYLSAVAKLKRRLSPFGVLHITGQTPDVERAERIDAFDNDPTKGIFIITAAGGESIDLTSASDFIYANKPITYADEKQGLDRIHRRGQRRNVRAFHIVTEGTVDQRIDEINARKKEEYERVVHGSAAFARWFEENEAENIKHLLSGMIGARHHI